MSTRNNELIDQRSIQSHIRLLVHAPGFFLRNTGEKKEEGSVEIGALSLCVIPLGHTDERVSVRNWGCHDRNLAVALIIREMGFKQCFAYMTGITHDMDVQTACLDEERMNNANSKHYIQ